ncbi:hypothetical protein E4N90_02290 [Treponema denticola]|uniref:hypothetical protein n=1 Tax=Treponema denticola TaxID=158 RepID=UPI0020A37715|nr:hypothetical protein [Treponema denticola]UTD06829.1 hypothetical protein E4N90_02290 [Treponema denticola]
MKKLLKILTTIAAVLTAALFFAGCKQFLEDPEEFLGYWSSEVVPIDFSIDEPYQMSNDGALCIPSAHDVTLKIKLRNPRNFALIMPTADSDAGRIIRFPGLPSDQQPRYGIDYTFKQTGDMLELTYKDTFLKAHEWSNGAIGPEITLISTDGRKFSKKFSLNIEVNTPPPEIGDVTIAKTKNDGMYVLHCKAGGMAVPFDSTTLLHKDIAYLNVQKEDGTGRKILISAQASQFDTSNGGPFLLPSTDVDPLIDTITPGNWELYVKTDTSLTESTLPQKYTVRLIDKKGLSSEPKEAKTLGSIPDISDNTKAWKKLKQAVEGAQEGGVITVMGNVKATNALGNNGAISVRKKKITIRKGGGITCELNANKNTGSKPAHRIFTVENGGELTLENITLTGGIATGTTLEEKYGGGILVKEGGKAKLKNCTIKKCEADKFGGGICSEGKLTLAGGTIGGSSTDANKAQYGGAICVRKGSVIMESGLLMTNKATTSGGGVNVDGYGASFTMTGGEIKSNNADTGGGGVFVHEGTFTLSGSASIESNTASGDGGGIYVDSTGKLVIEGGSIKSNMLTNTSGSGNGGGVYVYGAGSPEVRLNMRGGSIEGNSAGKQVSTYYGSGGGVYIKSSTFTMTGGEIKTNNAKNGGGVALDEGGTLEFSDGKIINNTAENNGYGGGICVGTSEDTDENTGTLKMTGGEISGNTAAGGGGIAVLHGTFTMSKGKVIGNTAAQKGGGILGFSFGKAEGEIKVSGGEISSNTAGISGTNAGGGICSRYKLTVSGGTIKDNTATNGYGGGIGVDEGRFDFSGGTVSGNETKNPDPASALGKGIFVDRRVTMTMSGSAKVNTDNNDVYLGNYGTTKAFITVTGSLTNKPAARLTMANDVTGYQTGRVVVKGGSDYLLQNSDIAKFPITKQTLPTTQYWTTELGSNQLKLKER